MGVGGLQEINWAELTHEKKTKDSSEVKSECPHISAVREEEVQRAWKV